MDLEYSMKIVGDTLVIAIGIPGHEKRVVAVELSQLKGMPTVGDVKKIKLEQEK